MGSAFHLSNRSRETLTRLTAALGLCSMEQIESIVFFFFLSNRGGRAGDWDEGQRSGSCLVCCKSAGMCQAQPPLSTHFPDLKRSPLCYPGELQAVSG